MKIGQRIKKRREALNITQQEMANAIDVTPQHISAVEQDKRIPSLPFLTKLSEYLGVSIDHLVSGKDVQGEVVLDSITAIKADKGLTPKVRKGLIAIVEEFRRR